jgi:hypothetical protein
MAATWNRLARTPEDTFTIRAGQRAWPANTVTPGPDGDELMVT